MFGTMSKWIWIMNWCSPELSYLAPLYLFSSTYLYLINAHPWSSPTRLSLLFRWLLTFQYVDAVSHYWSSQLPARGPNSFTMVIDITKQQTERLIPLKKIHGRILKLLMPSTWRILLCFVQTNLTCLRTFADTGSLSQDSFCKKQVQRTLH